MVIICLLVFIKYGFNKVKSFVTRNLWFSQLVFFLFYNRIVLASIKYKKQIAV